MAQAATHKQFRQYLASSLMFNPFANFFKPQSGNVLPLHSRDVRNTAITGQPSQPASSSISARPAHPQSALQAPRWISQAPVTSSPQENTAAAKRYLSTLRKQARKAGEDEDLAVISVLLGNEDEGREGKLNKSENKEAAVVYWNALSKSMLDCGSSTKRVKREMEEIRRDLLSPTREWLAYQPVQLSSEDSDSE